MKTLKFLIPVAVIALTLTSCHKGKIFGVVGKGNTITQTRNVSGFDKIHLSINADVYVVQDTFYSVEISAQSNVLSVLETEVEGNELEIDFDKRVLKHSNIKIVIHMPDVRGLSISGSGKIEAQSAISTHTMKLRISGSGDIYLSSLVASSLDANISGSGNIKIAGGTIASEDLNISGSGDIDALNAVAANCTAKISGSGNISAHVTNNLNATISGSGDIKYTGNPGVNVNVSGSGKVIHL